MIPSDQTGRARRRLRSFEDGVAETKPTPEPANSGLFAKNREISPSVGMRGGVRLAPLLKISGFDLAGN